MDEELSAVVEEVEKKEMSEKKMMWMDVNACGVMENMNQGEPEEWTDRVGDEVQKYRC